MATCASRSTQPDPVKPSPSRKHSAATCWSGCAWTVKGGSTAAICAMHRGSSGRCSKPRSRGTSSPTSLSATNRSTVRTQDTTCDHAPCYCERSEAIPRQHGAPTMLRTLLQGLRPPVTETAPLATLGAELNRAAQRRLGRSLSIREVDAGSCNGCELEIHALNNAFYDLERFGLRFVASPRHADVLMVTGPVTKNMREALERTYNATPDPKWVVAIGDCALDGGLFAESYAVVGGVSSVVPVDLHVRGCPPSPTAILKGLIALVKSANHQTAR